ncbi:hypothetical protein GIB67_007640 [Kingdonia uniflora]|uniref:RING-CH-type domain-containing protein n=1 Tax=Kingdonia uniflora TaxID=39325 RepID=A0A7J7N1D0_9MAGN|nr:hypothetical protein GIB67_007640 [Kingdonia uniflora]
MTTLDKPHVVEEAGGVVGRRPSIAESDESLSYSDAEDRSWHSPYESNNGYRFSNVSDLEIGRVSKSDPNRHSSATTTSDCSVEIDLENGVLEMKVLHLAAAKVEKICRICHLTLLESGNQEFGIPIELGCACKEDLAAAHKHCAEAWFKIKGNKTCEICGSVARNVVGPNETEFIEQWTDGNSGSAAPPTPVAPTESRSFVRGHRFLNFLLACMVFAFVISWLFHFNVPG